MFAIARFLFALVLVTLWVSAQASYATDCNGNGVEDALDLSTGTSTDCNANGIPDECDIAPVLDFYSVPSVDNPVFPLSLAAADIDGDGDYDLLGGNLGVSAFSVVRNDGTGIFGAPIQVAARHGWAIVADDFDGDGDPDVAISTSFSSGIWIYTNDGSGGFAYVGGVGGITDARSMISADVTGDGIQDLCLVEYSTSIVKILQGQGNASFLTLPATYTVGINPRTLIAADLDSDGDLDLLTANIGSFDVSILINQGGGVFTALASLPVSGNQMTIVAADFDADGAVDLVTGMVNGPGLPSARTAFLKNLGALTFAAPVYFASADVFQTSAMIAADIDGDLDIDLVMGSSIGARVSILKNDGSASFSLSAEYPAGREITALVALDIDMDGDIDLAETGGIPALGGAPALGDIHIYRNDGTGAFDASPFLPGVSSPQVATDIDGDGDEDVLGYGMLGHGVYGTLVYRNDGFNVLTPIGGIPIGTPARITAGDINGDLLPDIVAANYTSGLISVSMNMGGGAFGSSTVVATSPGVRGLRVVDVDGDALADLVWFADMGMIVVMRNLGGGVFAPMQSSPVNASDGSVGAIADVNGDLAADAAVTDSTTGGIAIVHNSGAGTYTTSSVLAIAGYPRQITLADIDADGDRDLVACIVFSVGSGELRTWLNDGVGNFGASTAVSFPWANACTNVAVLDLDGDQDLDVAVSVSVPSGVMIVRNLGGFTSFAPTVYFPGGAPSFTRVVVCDTDIDGRPDLLLSSVMTSLLSNISLFAASGDCNLNSVPDECDIASAQSFDLNQDAVPDDCQSVGGTTICSGDGSGAACPCSNTGGIGRGCGNSQTQGARLSASGMASVSADSALLTTSFAPPFATAMYFQSVGMVNGGLGTAFGDGLRCVNGGVIRLGRKFSVGGLSSYPGPLDAPISVRGNVPAGATRHYQAWYRDPANFCTSDTFNLTNGVRIVWGT